MWPVFADPKTDFVFKRIFGTEPNKHLLIELLNSLLELEGPYRIDEITFLTPEQKVPVSELKLSIVDVKCQDAAGNVYVVEMQVFNVEAFEKRVVYSVLLSSRMPRDVSKSYVMQIHSGEHYAQLSRSGSWVKIQLDHRQGWSYAPYTRSSGASVLSTTASALNVRTGPGTGYRVLGQAARGTKVVVQGSSGDWRKISWGGRAAYVHRSYLTGGNAPPPPPPPTGTAYTVSASTLNVRSGPGTNHSVLGQVSRGQRVTVIGSSGAWKQIRFGSGTGWVHGSYLTRGDRPTSSAGFIALRASGPGFYAYQPEYRRWGTPTLIYGIERAAARWNSERGGKSRIGVGDVSKSTGGYFSPHVSHRYGVDADVRPIRHDGVDGPATIYQSVYSRSGTQRVLNLMRAETPVTLILFNDSGTSGTTYYSGHHNHFHMRIRR